MLQKTAVLILVDKDAIVGCPYDFADRRHAERLSRATIELIPLVFIAGIARRWASYSWKGMGVAS
jgi:hypothetical protein